MARPTQVVEVPRFLLPGLAWNGTPLRTTLAQREIIALPGTKQQRRQLSGQNSVRRNGRRLLPSASSYLYHGSESTSVCRRLCTSPISPARNDRLTPNSSTNSLTTPVRYNGVYVAAFKPARRAFHATAVRRRDHHFDTLKFVQKMKNEGFSEEQAVATMRVLSDVIEESIQNLTRTMVLKEGEFMSYYKYFVWGLLGYLLERRFIGALKRERKD